MSTTDETKETCRIGVISDTHGLIRDEALEALTGVDHIIHAGDVGSPEVLRRLRSIALVTAVRGNMDAGELAFELTSTETVEIAGIFAYVLHDLHGLDLDPAAAGFHLVVSGHSHRPAREIRDGVLFINPGSAGPRRFKLPVTLAILEVRERRISERFISLVP